MWGFFLLTSSQLMVPTGELPRPCFGGKLSKGGVKTRLVVSVGNDRIIHGEGVLGDC